MPLGNLLSCAPPLRLSRALLKYAVGRQLAAVTVCILAAGIAQPMTAGWVLLPKSASGVAAAAVGAALLL